jgi:NhaA family Na+:H+ antiporter
MSQKKSLPDAPPETWEPARRIALTILRPLERFLHVQTASGIVLLACALVALAWANSPFGHTYELLWETPISISVGGRTASANLHFVINDVLMTVFFLVVGLEIRREIHQGDLSRIRSAILPVAAALGGMLFPALIYFAVSRGTEASPGWGVPMATDIAFAVGVLALLGKRVPSALRVLLLALAIIDDIGAILVIAVFYSGGVSLDGLLLAAASLAGVVALQRFGVRNPWLYVLPGILVWLGLYRSGVHPTLAGVLLGLLTPARPWFGRQGFVDEVRSAVEELQAASASGDDAHGDDLLPLLDRVKVARREAVAPVLFLQTRLHPYVAFVIMPLFALANAGVHLQGPGASVGAPRIVLLGTVLGLVLGKPLGIVAFSWLVTKLGLAQLPRGVRWPSVFVVGCVGGIGFTMAIFMAGLAFPGSELLDVAKLGVLIASATAGIIGVVAGLVLLPRSYSPDVALKSADDAERSLEY